MVDFCFSCCSSCTLLLLPSTSSAQRSGRSFLPVTARSPLWAPSRSQRRVVLLTMCGKPTRGSDKPRPQVQLQGGVNQIRLICLRAFQYYSRNINKLIFVFIINCTIVLLINTQIQIQKNFIVLLYKKVEMCMKFRHMNTRSCIKTHNHTCSSPQGHNYVSVVLQEVVYLKSTNKMQKRSMWSSFSVSAPPLLHV